MTKKPKRYIDNIRVSFELPTGNSFRMEPIEESQLEKAIEPDKAPMSPRKPDKVWVQHVMVKESGCRCTVM